MIFLMNNLFQVLKMKYKEPTERLDGNAVEIIEKNQSQKSELKIRH